MILRPTPRFVANTTYTYTSLRKLHHRIPLRPIPAPTPFVPDAPTFLSLIGRKLAVHAGKIPSWEALFTLSSSQLRELGVEPARSRRYLLQWREKFRNGEYGIGGDAKYVSDGAAELRLVEAPIESKSRIVKVATATHTPGTLKMVVNVPAGTTDPLKAGVPLKRLEGIRVVGAKTIQGPHLEIMKGTQGLGAKLRAKEGIWEVKRGRKIDGGERRQAEVRFKRRSEENKAKKR
ncbi:uncharacterized protein BDZ99DRAFT_462854 [Mytilinidion resinicola]|uniref:Small ribosomal subunit protein mS41 n=1 Tax=Mytilinidion resinicola TaxID=574789 RepID=A0A6A6YQK1_9PEZI|nr:uncharacterized protein BDZ99DRAFT_462854 [Mytilinidion resinicola]KAF2810265.1 hypothetical protein BDZ99DRAFT_462854 [Mytilinidion resinicola]